MLAFFPHPTRMKGIININIIIAIRNFFIMLNCTKVIFKSLFLTLSDGYINLQVNVIIVKKYLMWLLIKHQFLQLQFQAKWKILEIMHLGLQ